MAYFNKYVTSLYGRRFGIQRMTTAVAGISKAAEFLVGPEALRMGTTTGESTGTNVTAYGISSLPGTSAASSAVYVLDPPIPGVMKFVDGGVANGPVYLRATGLETFRTSAGSSFTTIKISSLGGSFALIGMTTAAWMTLGITTGTSSQASSFGLTTST
jgi:hypothetical protein